MLSNVEEVVSAKSDRFQTSIYFSILKNEYLFVGQLFLKSW